MRIVVSLVCMAFLFGSASVTAAAPCKGTKVLYKGKCVYPHQVPKKKKARKQGTAGGKCYGNNTCNPGLLCLKRLCRKPKRAKTGSLGGACYGNNTCNKGLDCVSRLCRRPQRSQAGSKEGPCYGNNTCNKGLSCVAGRCKAIIAKPGTSGGPCYGNNTCNPGLQCANSRCRPPQKPVGTLGGSCHPNSTCSQDLVCVAGTCRTPKIPSNSSLGGTWRQITILYRGGRRTPMTRGWIMDITFFPSSMAYAYKTRFGGTPRFFSGRYRIVNRQLVFTDNKSGRVSYSTFTLAGNRLTIIDVKSGTGGVWVRRGGNVRKFDGLRKQTIEPQKRRRYEKGTVKTDRDR